MLAWLNRRWGFKSKFEQFIILERQLVSEVVMSNKTYSAWALTNAERMGYLSIGAFMHLQRMIVLELAEKVEKK